jgi:beta-lactamase regulating signal transducer with metallopeptidase domain
MTPTVQAIAWTLIHFCWQAAAIAAAYRGLSLITAHRSSNTRYLLALSALLLMFGTSVATFAFELRFDPSSKGADQISSVLTNHNFSPVKTPVPDAPQSAASGPSAASSYPIASLLRLPVLPLPFLRAPVLLIIDGLWLLGVLTLSLRSFGGWWLIQRLRATANVEAPAAVRASFRRISSALGLRRPVLLRVSSAIAGPVTIGALRALVLLPLSAATSLGPDELEVVLAHELAHVRRADFFWNLVQTLVETLFFFHPAVWWIGSRIRHERELCCDDLALSVCPNPAVYANALFQLEQQRSRLGQLAMALDGHQPARTLRMRIARILGEPVADTANRGPFSLAAAAAVLVVLLLPVPQLLASLNSGPTAAVNASATAAPVAVQAGAAVANLNTSASSVHIATALAALSTRAAAVSTRIAVLSPRLLAQAATSEPQQLASISDDHKGAYIDRMKAAGYDVDLDKLIAMKIQDVTPEYAAAMSQLGFGKLSADDLIACKIQGVTPEYITQLKQGGLEVKDIHQAISYRIFEVTPEFIASMKAAGYGGLSSEQLLAMRVQGVTPEYARSIAQQFPGATAEDLVKTRIFNIDAAFIESAKKHGFTDLSLDKLVKLRISGILDDESTK